MLVSKAKITITIEVEFEQNPEFYPEDERTPEKMLAIDLAAARDDPFLTMDCEEAKWTIIGEIVKA